MNLKHPLLRLFRLPLRDVEVAELHSVLMQKGSRTDCNEAMATIKDMQSRTALLEWPHAQAFLCACSLARATVATVCSRLKLA